MSDALDAASAALDAGRPEEALDLLEVIDGPEAALVAAWAHLDLGELASARTLTARAREELGDEVQVLWIEAELSLREWRVSEARTAFEQLVSLAPEPGWLDRLALVHELEGDFAQADRLLERAARLDPSTPAPTRLDEAAFDAVVEQATTALPATFREALARCRVVAEPMPFRALIAEDDPGATPPDLFGLFTGPDLHDLAEDASGELPPTIYLFQRNLERACVDEATLREEIRITLYHELGHLLGLDEDEVDALGLG